MTDEQDGTPIGDWSLGAGHLGEANDITWLPSAHAVARKLRARLTIKGGLGREAETFSEGTRPSLLRVEEMIADAGAEVAAIAGNDPVEKIAAAAAAACVYSVTADIEASYEQESTGRDATNRDYFLKRFEASMKRLQEVVERIERGDQPGVDHADGTPRSSGATSIQRCGSGVSRVAW